MRGQGEEYSFISDLVRSRESHQNRKRPGRGILNLFVVG